jgi:hypothetical protein
MLKFAPYESDVASLNEVGDMAMYESDVTKFVRDLLEKQPELKELQRKNRATWWDKQLDFDQLKRNDASAAPKAPYAYFPLPEPSVSEPTSADTAAPTATPTAPPAPTK